MLKTPPTLPLALPLETIHIGSETPRKTPPTSPHTPPISPHKSGVSQQSSQSSLSPRLSPKGEGLSPRRLVQKFFTGKKTKPPLLSSQSEFLPTSSRTAADDSQALSPRGSESGASLKDVPPSRSLPDGIAMGQIEIVPLVNKEKKVTFGLSLRLDELIPQDNKPELWRKTLTYEVQVMKNKDRLNESRSYLWHTKNSLKMMYSIGELIAAQEIQRQQIQLFRELYDKTFEPVFQKFSTIQEEDYKQAEAFCSFLRDSIEVVMDIAYLKEPTIEKTALPDCIKLSTVMQQELYLKWYSFRASLVLKRLEFYKAEVKPPIDKIAKFIAEKIDQNKCSDIIEKLKGLSVDLSVELAATHQRIAVAAQCLEASQTLKGYLSLMAQLPAQGEFNKKVIERIAREFSQQEAHDRLTQARCTLDEKDFYISENSDLGEKITPLIIKFADEHTMLFQRPLRPEKIIKPHMCTILAIKLANELINVMQPQDRTCDIPLSTKFKI